MIGGIEDDEDKMLLLVSLLLRDAAGLGGLLLSRVSSKMESFLL